MPEFNLQEERRIYLDGIRLFNQGDFFEAHEAWEEVWKLAPDRRREQFYRAITQTAVTLELLRRGRAVGVRQVFVSSLKLFESLPTVFMGLDIGAFCEQVREAIRPALEDLQTRHVQIDPSKLFRIELAYDPFIESRAAEGVEIGPG